MEKKPLTPSKTKKDAMARNFTCATCGTLMTELIDGKNIVYSCPKCRISVRI